MTVSSQFPWQDKGGYMKLFKRKSDRAAPLLVPSQHSPFTGFELPDTVEPFEKDLFDRLRYTVPVIEPCGCPLFY